MRRRSLVLAVALACFASLAFAQAVKPHGDDIYTPQPGQVGKDVMWLGTPEAMVTAMLRAAKAGPDDFVADLGAGDGRIAIAAATEFGARSMGIEYDPRMAALAKRNAERAGVANRVTIVHGDIFKEDFSRASVVTLYLLPELNLQLRPQILAMKPGTRVVSHAWDMGEWEPDEAFVVEGSEGFLWIVPARVGGRWALRDDKDWEAEIAVTQEFQRIGGTITIKGRTQPLLGAYVNGAIVGFTFVDKDGAIRSMRGQVDGDRIAGQLRFVGNITLLTGRKL